MTGSSQVRVLLALIALVGTAQAEIRDFASPVTAQARDFQPRPARCMSRVVNRNHILEISESAMAPALSGCIRNRF